MHKVSRSSSALLARVLVGLTWTVSALSCGSCQRHATPAAETRAAPAAPVVVLHAGDRAVSFKVELARTMEEHNVGLMHRQALPPDQGMLFIFDKPAHQTFWMKNTLIPLDMLFIAKDGQDAQGRPAQKVLGIVSQAEPLTLSERSVPGDSEYVLEINGGLCERLGITPGSSVDFVHIQTP